MVLNKKSAIILSLSLVFFSFCSQGTTLKEQIHHRLYVGGLGGYGATTWEGLVPKNQNQNLALNMSTPIKVREGGAVWGLLVGFELMPSFALEFNYMKYKKATVMFDEMSLFTFNNENRSEFSTDTATLSLMAKAMFYIPRTKLRFYSSAGIADIHRKDLLMDVWHVGPTFGVGFNYPLGEHLMGELGGNYAAGFGESQLSPSDTYIPFLYSFTFRLAYMF